MPDGPVIVNNTPLVALTVLGRLDLLRDLYTEVLIPQAVYNEYLAISPMLRQDALIRAPWITPTTLTRPQRAQVYSGLGQGEAEVLALAEELSARLVIIDERKGRQYAKRLGLSLTGTLGVLLVAKEAGFIPAVAPLIGTLVNTGLHLDTSLIDHVLELANERPL